MANKGIPVDYCVRRHVKPSKPKVRYSAFVTEVGKTTSNRNVGGRDTMSAEAP